MQMYNDINEITQPMSLATLMYKHDTDKLYPHRYDVEYERHFGPRRFEALTLLEIGIGGYQIKNEGGAGLKTWADYFPSATIVGMDIEDKRFVMTERIWFWKGDQSDVKSLITLNGKMGPFDIVIDDGSHVQSDILASFNTLFPLLKPGGIYVIEDLATAYLKTCFELGISKRCGGHQNPLHEHTWIKRKPNTIRTICQLIDGIHHEFWRCRTPTVIQEMVKSVHVSKELAFIYKY